MSDNDLTAIYNSRTFCLYEDIDNIKRMGLAKGGTLDNAIVVQGDKILNEDGLRNRHEFVNHKILDCLGDIFMAGYRINGMVNGYKSGHELNNKLMHALFSNNENWCFKNYQKPKIQNNDHTEEKIVAIA